MNSHELLTLFPGTGIGRTTPESLYSPFRMLSPAATLPRKAIPYPSDAAHTLCAARARTPHPSPAALTRKDHR